MIRCDNKKCKHNDNFICGVKRCKSYEPYDNEDYAELMKEKNPNCSKGQAGFKSSRIFNVIR
jgi:hypothetical protein